MSGLTEVLIIPQMVSDAYSDTLGRLQDGYRLALAEYQAQCEAEQQEQAELAKQYASMVAAARSLAAQTMVTAAEDANITFLREHVQELAERLEEAPEANQELLAQCALLQEVLESPAPDLVAYFETYDRLFDGVMAQTAGPKGSGGAQSLHDALAILRDEITSPLLDAPECEETRAQLLAQLATLEDLAANRQQRTAEQGLAILRKRVQRALQDRILADDKQRKEAEEVREIASEALARLRALIQIREMPAYVRHAEMLFTSLRAEFSSPSADHIGALRTIAKETAELFDACEKLLREHAVSAYIGDNVQEVLLSLGYRVAQIAPDEPEGRQTFVATLDESLGVEVQVDGNGRVTTEMVALNDEAAVDPATQERVCSMIDQLVAALKARDWNLRERHRSTLEKGKRLKVVKLAKTETEHEKTTTPKQKRIDE